MKIVHANEKLESGPIIIAIYGQAGIGKTSAAFSADAPLLIDFDHGAHRSGFRRDTATVSAWSDVAAIKPADVAGYNTIIIDTAGRAVDMLAASIMQANSKMANAQGALTLQGYGALKAGFQRWLSNLRALGKDIILIAHDKEERVGDDSILVRPDVAGSSVQEIYKVADSIAYMHAKSGERTMEFSPSDTSIGKDPADIGALRVPNLHETPDFMAGVIMQVKDSISQLSEEGKIVAAEVALFDERLNAAATADDMNGLMADMATARNAAKRVLWPRIKAHGEQLGLSMKGKRYV